MSESFSTNGKKNNLSKGFKQYVEKRVELLSLSITERVSRIVAESFQQILGMFILSFALFFFWFAVGFFLGEIIGSLSAGFAIAAIPLFLIGFVLMNGKSKKLTEKVQTQLMIKVLEDLDIDKESNKIEGKTVEQ